MAALRPAMHAEDAEARPWSMSDDLTISSQRMPVLMRFPYQAPSVAYVTVVAKPLLACRVPPQMPCSALRSESLHYVLFLLTNGHSMHNDVSLCMDCWDFVALSV